MCLVELFFPFFFNCVGQFKAGLDMNEILVCIFTWRVAHNLGSFFKHPLVPGNALKWGL